MDGSNQTNIVDTFITWPNGLTLDYEEKRVYWIDARYNYIASVDYHGTNRRITYTQAVNHPYALTIFAKQLYWTDWDTNSIRNCRVLSSNMTYDVSVIKTNIYYPMDIKVYEAGRQPNGKL
jgi:low density lipoprotein receptor-related protein 5/6